MENQFCDDSIRTLPCTKENKCRVCCPVRSRILQAGYTGSKATQSVTMTTVLEGLALFPVVVHLLTGMGVVFECGSLDAEKDSFDWWVATIINCFRFGLNGGGNLTIIAAWIQITGSVVAMATLSSSAYDVRRVGYLTLLFIYCVTQLRHIMMGEGPESIGFFYTHIFIFAVLVLHFERTLSSSVVN